MRKPYLIVAGVMALGVILVVVGVMRRPSAPPQPALVIHYEPSVCADAWNKPDINKSAFTGTNFVVDLHEGCFHEVVIMPKAHEWEQWRLHVEHEGQGDCWYAIWPNGKQRDSGVIRCNGNGPLPFFAGSPALRLQGQEGLHIRFYTSSWTQ